MAKTGCKDSSCLKKQAEILEPECAAFLLGVPEPSPAPMPREATPSISVSFHGSQADKRPTIEVVEAEAPVTVKKPNMMMMSNSPIAFPAIAATFFPPEIMQLMNSAIRDAVEIQAEREERSQHPCEREVAACTRLTGDSSRSGIESCLLRHADELSPPCRCFFHHVTAARSTAPAKPVSAVVGKVVTMELPQTYAMEVRTVDTSPEEMPRFHMHGVPPPPMHRLACLLIFTSLFLLSFLVARACIVLLCCRRRARSVVVVPPEQAVIKTIGEPVTSPILITEVVQVAEPLKA